MVYKRNYLWLFGVLLSTLFMTSCSDEHEALQSTDQTSTVVQASVSAFKVDGKISSVAGENEINDIQACLFENGLMTAVYSNLDQTSDSYSLKLKSMSGTLYMLANTADLIDLQQMKESGMTEQEWLNTTIKATDGKAPRFFAGKLNLDEQPQGQYVLPMTLQHGIARFDLLMRAGGAISIKSITLKNLAQASYLISQDEVRSPEGADVQDLQFTFDQPLLKDTLGLAYVCEQTNTDLMVEVEMEMGGQIYVQQAALPSVLKRNTVYTLTVRKDALSADIKLEVSAWEDGGETGLHPDWDSHITVNKGLSVLPEGITISESGDVVSLPSRAMEFTLALNCDDELEFVSSQSSDITVEKLPSVTPGDGVNRFLFRKTLLPPGYQAENVKVYFHRKGLNESYEEDCLKLVLEENPIHSEGFKFDRQNYTHDFGRYIDNEMGRFIMPEGLELVAEFNNEDPWVKIEKVADETNTYRVIGGWKPNDPKADGRKQAARLVVRRISDGQETEAYIVERRNYGLPVTYLNGTWWCRYNAIGDSRNFDDQILSSNDPASLAGQTVQEYLKTCSSEEYVRLWNAAYEGNNGMALQAVYRDGKVTLDGWRSGESNHINKAEPTSLSPDGYEMPTFDDYNDILSNFPIPTNWAGFYPQNDKPNRQYRSEIILEKRSGVQLDGQDLGELWSFSVRSIAGHGDEPLTFYGVGCQWNNDGVNRNWLLLACYNPEVTGWLVRGNNASLEHNGAGANNTRNVRFKKSPVEYIYQ